MEREEKDRKLAAWRALADQWRKRLIDSYYAMRPGKRHEVFDRCRGRLGELEMRIQQLQGSVPSEQKVGS